MFTIELLLFLFTLIIVKIYLWYKDRKHTYAIFKRNNIVGPVPSFIFGNFKEYRRTKNPDEQYEIWLQEYGNIFGYFEGMQPVLVINDLDIIKKLFISKSKEFSNRQGSILNVKPLSDCIIFISGERWKRIRKIMSPTFSLHRVLSPTISTTIDNCVERFIEAIKLNGEYIDQNHNNDNEYKQFTIDIYPSCQAFTMDVISQTSLNMISDVYSKDNELMNSVREYFENTNNELVRIAFLFASLRSLMTFIYNYCTAGKMTDIVVKRLREQINSFVNNKENLNKKQNFLNSLINSLADGQINEDEFLGNILVIILAGYETTSNAITFTLYLLAMHQNIQDRLREDIAINGLKSEYYEMVWMEALRLYPPVTQFVRREVIENVEIDNLKLEKSMLINLPIWHIHHRDDIWPEPFKFDPERFSIENRKHIHAAAYFPFGLSQRMCLGNHLAYYESRKLITELITKFKIELDKRTPDKLPLKIDSVIINPDCPVYLKFICLEKV